MSDLRILDDAEIDLISGAGDRNYKECPLGTTAGGGPGLYPTSAVCSTVGTIGAAIIAGANAAIHHQ